MAMQRDVMNDLAHTGLIAVTGRDATTFLQGQATCDIREINATTSRLGAICNHQGRVITTFRVFQRAGEFYLTLATDCVAPTIQYLSKYLLRSQVKLRDATSDWMRIGCAGMNIINILQQYFSVLPNGSDQVIQQENITLLRVADDPPRLEIIGESAPIKQLWESLADRVITVETNEWIGLEILNGFPIITPATSATFVPHMLNLPELGAVSFSKGCYTGQEIVARTQYLGKTKRRLYRVRILGNTPLAPGEILWAPIEITEGNCGQIINCAPNPQGEGLIALAVISDAALETGEVRLNGANGQSLELI